MIISISEKNFKMVKNQKIPKKYINKDSSNKTINVLVKVQRKGRQTNNSLASIEGPLLIDAHEDILNNLGYKGLTKHTQCISSFNGYKYSFGMEEEEQQVGMHKVLKILKNHKDSWPFTDPVEERYAPSYYSVVRQPMDLNTMENKLDAGRYGNVNHFKQDFNLIIENCKQYNGPENEYTEMVMNLKEVFDREVNRYFDFEQTSDDAFSTKSETSVESPNHKSKKYKTLSITHQRLQNKHLKAPKKHKSLRKICKKNIFNEDTKQENEADNSILRGAGKCLKNQSKRVKNKTVKDKIKSDGSAINMSNKVQLKKKIFCKVKKVESENDIKSNAKVKKEHPKKDVKSVREIKSNDKKRDDFKNDYNTYSKTKKNDKKGNKELDIMTDKGKKNKSKKKKLSKIFVKNEKNSFSFSRNRKINQKINTEKEQTDSEKGKKSKQELLKDNNIKMKEINSINIKENLSENFKDKLSSDKDIESLDSLKDRISGRRLKKKIKWKKNINDKLGSTDNSNYETKKVPSKYLTTNCQEFNLSRRKNVKSRVVYKKRSKSQCDDSKSKDRNSKKMKYSLNKKEIEEFENNDIAIQALNQATEETLNNMNKWLDKTPNVSNPILDSDKKISSTSLSNATNLMQKKQFPKSDSFGISLNAGNSNSSEISLKKPGIPKIILPPKSRKVHRTIDRLQPGKSKGNLLFRKHNMETSVKESSFILPISERADTSSHNEIIEQKLSLGTVLKNDDSIHLIRKSLIPSPNANISVDDCHGEEFLNKMVSPLTVSSEQDAVKSNALISVGTSNNTEEISKPKATMPNFSAWFKAFGAPKSKKKEDDEDNRICDNKKQELCANNGMVVDIDCIPTMFQRRASIGESSIGESLSPFSQESSPGNKYISETSPQTPSYLSTTAFEKPQTIQAAGFYQDVQLAISSPYNSPSYYTTSSKSNAQLSTTPSYQRNPLSVTVSTKVSSYDQDQPPSMYSQQNQKCFMNSILGQSQSPVSFQQDSSSLQSTQQSQSSAPENNIKLSSQVESPISQTSEENVSQSSRQSHLLPTSAYPQNSPEPIQSSPSHLSYSQVSSKSYQSTHSEPPHGSNYTTKESSPQCHTDMVIIQPRRNIQSSSQESINHATISSLESVPHVDPLTSHQQPQTYSHSLRVMKAYVPMSSNHQSSKLELSNNQMLAQRQQIHRLTQDNNYNKSSEDLNTSLTSQSKLCINQYAQIHNSGVASSTLTSNIKSKQEQEIPLLHQIYQTTPVSEPTAAYNTNTVQSTDKLIKPQIIQNDNIIQDHRQHIQLLNQMQSQSLSGSHYESAIHSNQYSQNSGSKPGYPNYFDASSKAHINSSVDALSLTNEHTYNEKSIQLIQSTIPQKQITEIPSIQNPFCFSSISASEFESTGNLKAKGIIKNVINISACTHGQPEYIGRCIINNQKESQSLAMPRQQDKLNTCLPSQQQLNTLQSFHTTNPKADGIRSKESISSILTTKTKRGRRSKIQPKQEESFHQMQQKSGLESGFTQYINLGSADHSTMSFKKSPGAYNLTASNTSYLHYDKEASYAFLDELRSSNLQEYYSMAVRQQSQQHSMQQQQIVSESAEIVNHAANAAAVVAAASNFSGHSFLHTTAQRNNPYGPPLPPYVPPHGTNVAVDPTAYQHYLHSFYALSPSHHRPTWL